MAEILTKRDFLIYDHLNRPEHAVWKSHRDLLSHLTAFDAAYRGCFGLGLVISEHTNTGWHQPGDGKVLVPDKYMRWLTMVDVPAGYFRVDNGRRREVIWATTRSSTLHCGLPRLDRETDPGWDFRALTQSRTEDLPVLDVENDPHLFRAFNAMNWAMTSVAFMFRSKWQYARPVFDAAMTTLFGCPADRKGRQTVIAGNGVYDGFAYPRQWMPQPYIAVREERRDDVFDKATVGADGYTEYSRFLDEAFLDAMGDNLAHLARFDGVVSDVRMNAEYCGIPVVSVTLTGSLGEAEVVRFTRGKSRLFKRKGEPFSKGDTIGDEKFDSELPVSWDGMSREHRVSAHMWRLLGRRADAVMRLWFDRQGFCLIPGLVHFPAALASNAAVSLGFDTELLWDVSGALEYYRDDCESFVFPPVPIKSWFDLTGQLPGDVCYDLHPSHPTYHGHRAPKSESHARGAKSKSGK